MGVSEIEEICCDDPILNVENLTVLRSGKLVLSDINLTVHKGEFIGIVGPNGSGKSTLLHSILGFLKAHQGNISIYGNAPNPKLFYGRVGWVSQAASNLPRQVRLTIRELVGLGTISGKNLFSWSNSSSNQKVNEAIRMVGLEDVSDVDVSKLSGGQRQRAVIARALATRPRLLICDEPTSALDVSIQAQILNLLKDIQDELHLTMLFISHDLPVIRQMCNRIVVLKNGSICETKDTEELFNNPEHNYTKELIKLMPKIETLI